MRLNNYKDLLEIINQTTDLEDYFLRNPSKFTITKKEILPYLGEENREKNSYNIIMNMDGEGVITSYPNNELTVNRLAIKRKIKYLPILEHRHEYIEIVYVLEGSFIQNIKGKQINMVKGDLCILDKNVLHSSLPLGETDVAVNIILTPKFFDGIFMNLLSNENYISNFIVNSLYSKNKSQNYLKQHVNEGSVLKMILENLLYEYFSSNTRSFAAINGYLLIFFTELSREFIYSTGQLVDVEEKKIKEKILLYIRKQYKDTNLKDMAEYLHFHPSYLSSLIKKEFGKNLKDLLTDIRMSEASSLLKNTDMTIETILNEVGYTNYSYFYKVFKKTFGMTPNQYKDSLIKA